MNKTKVKAIAGVLIVFLLGALFGALGTGLFIRHKFREFTEGKASFQKFFMRRLTRELKLTDEQESEVRKILEQTGVEIRQFLRDSHGAFEKIMQRRNTQLKEILTPGQQKKLDEMFERIQKHWHRPPFSDEHHENSPQ